MENPKGIPAQSPGLPDFRSAFDEGGRATLGNAPIVPLNLEEVVPISDLIKPIRRDRDALRVPISPQFTAGERARSLIP